MPIELDLRIDRLTRSIVNVISGDTFVTEVLPLAASDTALLRTGWRFDWRTEMTTGEAYKLVITGNRTVIQGLISIADKQDHIFINLIESASFNIGRNKIYDGVGGNLFAFACKESFDRGYQGFVVFHAKSSLVRHYSSRLGARRIGRSLVMIIETEAALELVKTYYRS